MVGMVNFPIFTCGEHTCIMESLPGGGGEIRRQCLGTDTFWFGVLRRRHGIFFFKRE